MSGYAKGALNKMYLFIFLFDIYSTIKEAIINAPNQKNTLQFAKEDQIAVEWLIIIYSITTAFLTVISYFNVKVFEHDKLFYQKTRGVSKILKTIEWLFRLALCFLVALKILKFYDLDNTITFGLSLTMLLTLWYVSLKLVTYVYVMHWEFIFVLTSFLINLLLVLNDTMMVQFFLIVVNIIFSFGIIMFNLINNAKKYFEIIK